MFLGSWHRRTILPPRTELPVFPLEEKEIVRRERRTGGTDWVGEQARWWDGGTDVFTTKSGHISANRSESEESFDLMAGAEAEASVLLESLRDEMPTPELEKRVWEGSTGQGNFEKM
jgi:D-arabinono-1,4-lactone oxidase